MKGAGLKRAPRPSLKKKKKSDSVKLYSSPPKILFRDPIGHELPPSLQKFRWDGDKVGRKLQEKIQEKTQIAGNFVYQQAYRLLEGTRGEGINFFSFREQLRVKFGILLDDSELRLLFDKYDEDGNGKIDMQEFIRRVLPPDYNYGRQWFEISQLEGEEKAARLRHEARQEFLVCQGAAKTGNISNMGVVSNWTIKQLMMQIQAKVVQKTPSSEDQYRRAFKMLRSGRDQGIRMNGLQFNLKTKFGIYATDDQMRQLFSMCDQDSNGEIDLKEFLQFVDPPAYPPNNKVPGGIWTQSDSEDEDAESVKNRLRSAVMLKERPASVSSQRSALSVTTGGNCFCTNMLSQGRKERPRTADPRKTLMLQQRREMVEKQRLTRHNHQRSFLVSKETNLETLSLSGECEENGELSCPLLKNCRQWSSVGDCSGADTDSITSPSNRSYIRPRSASSARSYASSSCNTITGSIRGATYMKRPTTPQTLRQKCLESRKLSGGAAGEAIFKTRKKLAPAKAAQDGVVQRNHCAHTLDTERHHSLSEASVVLEYCNGCSCTSATTNDHDVDRYAPRVVRVHAMQHNAQRYTPEGRVLRRSKILSCGCL